MIRVEHLVKRFPGLLAVDDVSFEVEDASLTALLGPSGGGKSTVLRLIAGLEDPDEGSVVIDGVVVDGVHTRSRHIGFVFQSYALFRHMSVVDNVAFGLLARGEKKMKAHARARELLAVVGLEGLGERMPAELSGGQRQRVALARAVAPEPRVLLLDEPFSAVDARVRDELRAYLRRIHDERGITTVFVTHDQDEAFELADNVIVINKGKVEQQGTPSEVLAAPATDFVAYFVGRPSRSDVVTV